MYPRVSAVVASTDKSLLVTFDNGVCKRYDCSPLLTTEAFRPLAQNWLFRLVHVDTGGYGVSWNEEIDLSESELWEHGQGEVSNC
jgi:hypothetical protein